MAHFLDDTSTSKDMISHRYSGISKEDLTNAVDNLLSSNGYGLIEGTPGNATYEKGNRVMRILLGAFSKYFKFKVMVEELSDGEVGLKVIRATSGMSGGVIGMNQVTSEMVTLSTQLKQL